MLAWLLPLLADGPPQSSALQTFFLVVMIVVAGFLYLRSQRYFAKQKNDAGSAVRPATSPLEKQYTPVPQDLTRWEVEMHDTARQLSGQLDSKMAALGHLIHEADRAAARLEAALSATRSPTAATTTTDAAATAGLSRSSPLATAGLSSNTPCAKGDSSSSLPCATAGLSSSVSGAPGDSSAGAGPPEEPPSHQARALQAAEEPHEPGPDAGSAATSRPPADHRYEEIYLLADYGFNPAEIGHRVGMPVGEIQLILSLRAKR